MKIEITTDLGTYTVEEVVTRDGRLVLAFGTSNPPRGLDEALYRWEGRVSALSAPFTEQSHIGIRAAQDGDIREVRFNHG